MNLHDLLRDGHLGLFYMHAGSPENTKNSFKNQYIQHLQNTGRTVGEHSGNLSSLFVSADLA